jgi:hypothetical protein
MDYFTYGKYEKDLGKKYADTCAKMMEIKGMQFFSPECAQMLETTQNALKIMGMSHHPSLFSSKHQATASTAS